MPHLRTFNSITTGQALGHSWSSALCASIHPLGFTCDIPLLPRMSLLITSFLSSPISLQLHPSSFSTNPCKTLQHYHLFNTLRPIFDLLRLSILLTLPLFHIPSFPLSHTFPCAFRLEWHLPLRCTTLTSGSPLSPSWVRLSHLRPCCLRPAHFHVHLCRPAPASLCTPHHRRLWSVF